MRSKLFEIHIPGTSITIPIFAYGFMVMIGFLVGVYVARWRARREGLEPDAIVDLGLVALVSGILGARLFHVIQFHREYFGPGETSPLLRILQIWRGGLVFYGGFLAAGAGVLLFLRWRKLELAQSLDVIAPSVILGLAFGRIGCFLNGCCYGIPADPKRIPWAVVFPSDALAYNPYGRGFPSGTPLHPTQIYEMLAALGIFAILTLHFRFRRRYGEVATLLFLLYPGARFFIEFLRGDTATSRGLTVSQTVSLVVFLPAAILFCYLRKLPSNIRLRERNDIVTTPQRKVPRR